MKISSKGIITKTSILMAMMVGLALGLVIPAQAGLIDRGLFDDGQSGMMHLIYDDDLGITWMGDANFGAGSAFDEGTSTTDGGMSWQNAVDWAASLTVGGFTNWRLPTTTQPDLSCSLQTFGLGGVPVSVGEGCTGSELGHLHTTELGGLFVPFTNVQENGAYWSGTEWAPQPTIAAWAFDWGIDHQNGFLKVDVFRRFAWAVRSGDVPDNTNPGGAAPIPEPSTLLLMGTGLAALGAWRHRKGMKS